MNECCRVFRLRRTWFMDRMSASDMTCVQALHRLSPWLSTSMRDTGNPETSLNSDFWQSACMLLG